MRPRVVIVGATGVFGERLASRLSLWPDIELVLAARRLDGLEKLAAAFGPNARAGIEVAVLDRDAPEGLAGLRPMVVIDCAGPFQGSDYGLAQAALDAGAHYTDLADGREFVAGFAAALDAPARQAGRLAVTGASSTPALSHAVIERLTQNWGRIDRLLVGISPGARAPQGLAAVRAITSWTGRPVRVFLAGRWQERPGWGLLRRQAFPGLGRRWLSLAETPDLDLLPLRFKPGRDALFMGGMELGIMHLGLWLVGGAVRLGLTRSAAGLARPLQWAAGLVAWSGSDAGGMVVEAEGLDACGQPILARWSLCVRRGLGPHVPTLAAAAVVRGLVDGRLQAIGAEPCVGMLSEDEILREGQGLPIEISTDRSSPRSVSLFRRLMGPGFEVLSPPLQQAHAGLEPVVLRGSGLVKGGAGLAALVRIVLGLPAPGRRLPCVVEIAPQDGRETWLRQMGPTVFRSRLRGLAGQPGQFEEQIGPLTFRLWLRPSGDGFRFMLTGWRLGAVWLPGWLGPKIRSRTFARDGLYRYVVVLAHPWLGILSAYAGRLSPATSAQSASAGWRLDARADGAAGRQDRLDEGR